MAKIGMRYAVYAPISAYAEGSAITYGTGGRLGPARSAEVTFTRNDNPLYGDDVIQEQDTSITSYQIAFDSTTLTDEMRAAILGEVAGTSGAAGEYSVTDAAAPNVGFGYIRVMRRSGVTYYESFFFWKVQFSLDNESDNTKEEQINWGTNPITGRGQGVYLDSTGAVSFYVHKKFDTFTAAKTWLDGKANISSSTTT